MTPITVGNPLNPAITPRKPGLKVFVQKAETAPTTASYEEPEAL